jgi:hypothetical protein
VICKIWGKRSDLMYVKACRIKMRVIYEIEEVKAYGDLFEVKDLEV